MGFPGGTSGKEPACQYRNMRDVGSIPGWGRRTGGGHGNHPVFLPGESHGQRSLASCSSWVPKNWTKSCWSDLARSCNLILLKVLPSWSTHLPKSPPPNTIILGIRFLTYEFWRNANIQTVGYISPILYVWKPIDFKIQSCNWALFKLWSILTSFWLFFLNFLGRQSYHL